jgi:chemotaxis protein CheD
MNKITISIADMAISDNPGDTLITYSLGSCVGVAIYDPELKLGGLIHCMLPLSKTNREKAQSKPCMFVDTGLNLLLSELFGRGLQRKRAIVKVAGCSRILDVNSHFNIGERNFTICRKFLWKNNMLIENDDTGDDRSRTLSLNIATGQVLVKSKGAVTEL